MVFIIFWYWLLIAFMGTFIKSINRDITMQDAAAPWVLWPVMLLIAIGATFWAFVYEKGAGVRAAIIEIWTELLDRLF